MQKVHLTRVFTTNKDKDGNPLVSKKTGKLYTRQSIQTVEYGAKWLDGFTQSGAVNEFWKEGDTVDIIVKENGQYLNFDTPKKEDMLEIRVKALEVTVVNLTNAVARLSGTPGLSSPAPSNPAGEDFPDF